MVRHASVHVYGVRAGGVPEHWVRFACFLVVSLSQRRRTLVGQIWLRRWRRGLFLCALQGMRTTMAILLPKYLALDLVNWLLAVDKAKAPSLRRQIVTPNDQDV